MKTQDLLPYHQTLQGLEDKLKPIGKDSFLINPNCILAPDHVVTTGKTYLLFDYSEGRISGAAPVVLEDVKFITSILKGDILKIVVYDNDSNRVLHRTHPFNNESPCDWLLAEKDYFNDDLLEFEF